MQSTIEVMHELRPCLWTETNKRALFHGLERLAYTCAAGLTIGSAPGGQMSRTTAIIESADGSLYRVEIDEIIFLDTKEKMLEFCWEVES